MTLYSMKYPCGNDNRRTGTMLVNLDHFVYCRTLDGPDRRFLLGGRGDYEVRFAEATIVIERDEWARMKAVLSRMSQRGVNVLGEEPGEPPDPYEARVETPQMSEGVAGLRFSPSDISSITPRRMPYPNPFDDSDISADISAMSAAATAATATGGAP